MYALLLTTLATMAPGEAGDTKAMAAPNLDGKWLIVYSEQDGKRNTAWESKVATGSGKTLTYGEDAKESSIALSFGNHQTVKATLSGGEAKGAYRGVYIAGRDYLCLSLDPDKAGKTTRTGCEDKEAPPAAAKGGASSASFILILRRQRTK